MSSPLVLELRDKDPWHVMESAHNIISDYLNSDDATSALDTAERLDQLSPDRRTLEEDETAESWEDYYHNFWWMFVDLAPQVPFGSVWETRLVELVKEMSFRPGTDERKNPWRPVQCELENRAMMIWDAPAAYNKEWPIRSEWININSILAKLHTLSISPSVKFAFWTLWPTLEGPLPKEQDILECKISAAAMWMHQTAAKIFAVFEAGEKALDEGDRRSLSSQMYDMTDPVPMERWAFWKLRFQECAELDVSETTRYHATKAAAAMDEVGSTKAATPKRTGRPKSKAK